MTEDILIRQTDISDYFASCRHFRRNTFTPLGSVDSRFCQRIRLLSHSISKTCQRFVELTSSRLTSCVIRPIGAFSMEDPISRLLILLEMLLCCSRTKRSKLPVTSSLAKFTQCSRVLTDCLVSTREYSS